MSHLNQIPRRKSKATETLRVATDVIAIHTAFKKPSNPYCQKNLMTYKDKLNPWCIIRPVSAVQMRIVGRFRRRVDAEGHIRILKQLMPTIPFEIMFDIAIEDTDQVDPTHLPSRQ